jgi:RimJ/RimL family protein N-acetyltransferase
VEVFRSERLLLRPFTAADVELLVELDGDPEVRRFLADGRPVPREVVERETLPGMFDLYRNYPGFGCRAVFAGPEFLGWVELLPEDGPGEASIGWRFLPRAWGHGYATEAARVLLDRVAPELGVRRVTATTMTVNTASRRVMEKLGMVHVRTFFDEWPDHIEGAEQGDVEYELILSEEPVPGVELVLTEDPILGDEPVLRGRGTPRSARPAG